MKLSPHDFLIAVLWALWCIPHSVLITPGVMAAAQRRLGTRFRFYRLFYNVVSFLTLIPVLYYSSAIPQEPFFRWQGPGIVMKFLLIGIGLYLFLAGGRHYSLWPFLGIQQIRTGRRSQALTEYDTLDTSGIHRIIRHPWYTGGILIVWARDISPSIFLTNIVVDAYFVIGAILEERKLLAVFGEQYKAYQKQVSMFIPLKWLKSKLTPVP